VDGGKGGLDEHLSIKEGRGFVQLTNDVGGELQLAEDLMDGLSGALLAKREDKRGGKRGLDEHLSIKERSAQGGLLGGGGLSSGSLLGGSLLSGLPIVAKREDNIDQDIKARGLSALDPLSGILSNPEAVVIA
jgi:hypothetical protein